MYSETFFRCRYDVTEGLGIVADIIQVRLNAVNGMRTVTKGKGFGEHLMHHRSSNQNQQHRGEIKSS